MKIVIIATVSNTTDDNLSVSQNFMQLCKNLTFANFENTAYLDLHDI